MFEDITVSGIRKPKFYYIPAAKILVADGRTSKIYVRAKILFDNTSAAMKISKSDALSATFSRPELRFEQQDLTSFSGLVLLTRLRLYRRLPAASERV